MPMRQFDRLLQANHAQTTIAVAGASAKPTKYGNIISRFLAAQGYSVWPINPTETHIGSLPAFGSITSLPDVPDILNVVTPPHVTASLLKEAAAAGVSRVWLQPGSFNSRVLAAAATSGMLVESQRCIMVVSAQWVGEPTAAAI